jgi:hypothetical protein
MSLSEWHFVKREKWMWTSTKKYSRTLRCPFAAFHAFSHWSIAMIWIVWDSLLSSETKQSRRPDWANQCLRGRADRLCISGRPTLICGKKRSRPIRDHLRGITLLRKLKTFDWNRFAAFTPMINIGCWNLHGSEGIVKLGRSWRSVRLLRA